jgi:hypothetical protein
MVATNSPDKSTPMTMLEQLQQRLPQISFVTGTTFCWSPKSRSINYPQEALSRNDGIWALLHECGHALLDHQTYKSDFELLTMEVAAWEKAKKIASEIGVVIDGDHIQDCLDTYRDWLHKRSMCPTCGSVSLQQSENLYACHNCPAQWHVTRARLCRPYRKAAFSSNEKRPTLRTPSPSFQ